VIRPIALIVWALLTITVTGAAQLSTTFVNWRDHPAIAYETTSTADPVSRLNLAIQAGRVELKYDGPSGYLRSVLDALNVPVDSQMAVFAKDSVQSRRISAGNPRTIFFNDSVAVGWVRGGFIEIASQDPRQGVIFYTLEQRWMGQPRFKRENACLTCHYAYSTVGVPGMLVRGVGQFEVDHRVPLAERWGGWYVTGTHGSIRHTGNIDTDQLFDEPRPAHGFNWPSLDGKFDNTGYLTAHSDIVALLVFEHQMHMMNLLTRIGWEARVARHDKTAQNAAAAREVVDYLLFIDEAPFPDAVQGSTGFAATFAARGPRDSKGRSLRDLDLKRRLLRYRCSYVVYTELFDELPAEAKAAVYRRLWEVLSGHDKDARYTRLSAVDRRAIVEILRDTKADLPVYFQSSEAAPGSNRRGRGQEIF
jgi:hypothetical protein